MIVGTINEIINFLEKAQALGMTTLAELIEYLSGVETKKMRG